MATFVLEPSLVGISDLVGESAVTQKQCLLSLQVRDPVDFLPEMNHIHLFAALQAWTMVFRGSPIEH